MGAERQQTSQAEAFNTAIEEVQARLAQVHCEAMEERAKNREAKLQIDQADTERASTLRKRGEQRQAIEDAMEVVMRLEAARAMDAELRQTVVEEYEQAQRQLSEKMQMIN